MNRKLLDLGMKEKYVHDAYVAAMNAVQMKEDLHDNVLNCGNCNLYRQCKRPVPGAGNSQANIMLVGEAPGEDEDKYGVPFVGTTGQLLTLFLNKMGVDRNRLWITNAVKCRPPKNRTPHDNELEACGLHLHREIRWVKPSVIVTLGNPAMHLLMHDSTLKITKERGRWKKIRISGRSIDVIHTYHPSYVCRQKGDDLKRAVKEMYGDLKMAMMKGGDLDE